MVADHQGRRHLRELNPRRRHRCLLVCANAIRNQLLADGVSTTSPRPRTSLPSCVTRLFRLTVLAERVSVELVSVAVHSRPLVSKL